MTNTETDYQKTEYGFFRQKDGTEPILLNFKPKDDPNNYTHLASLLLKNWSKGKNHCISVNGHMFPGFNETLEKDFVSLAAYKTLSLNSTPSYRSADLINILFDAEKSYFSLGRALDYLREDGTLFLRILKADSQSSLQYLKHGGLSQLVNEYWVANEISMYNRFSNIEGEFFIKEVYDIGEFKDFLIQYREKKTKVCIGLIVKNEERDLPKLLQTLHGSADAIMVFDTGSTDKTQEAFHANIPNTRFGEPMLSYYSSYFGASTQDESGDWKLWNFGQARNQYVDKIEKDGYDYVLWMDADDTVDHPHLLALLPLFEQYVVHGITMDTGGSSWIHHRMWKTRHGIKYSGRCHEYPTIGSFPCMLHPKIVVKHDAAPVEGTENSNDRNLRILNQAAKEEPTPRIHFYLANTYKDRGVYDQAAHWYQKRIDDGVGYYDEYVFAILYKGRCERAALDVMAAEKTLVKGYNLTKWAEFSMELCYMYMGLGRYPEALEWALKAIQDWNHKPPVTALWREDNKYTDQPYRMATWICKHLGKKLSALKYGLKVLLHVQDASWHAFVDEIQADVFKQVKVPASQAKKFRRPGAIGDILMCATVMQQYRKENPDKIITFIVHDSLKPMVEPILLQAGVDVVHGLAECTKEDSSIQDLIGYPLAEGYPDKPMAKHLIEYLSKEVGVKEEVHQLSLPKYPNMQINKYATLHPQALWSPYKNWDLNNWSKVIERLEIPVYQIGAKDDLTVVGVDQSYLGFALNTALHLISHASVHLGVDSWSNHATNIVWESTSSTTPGVILWGSTQSEAAGYKTNRNITNKVPCQPCFKEDPKISQQSKGICTNAHACMTFITVDKVVGEINDVLGKGKELL